MTFFTVLCFLFFVRGIYAYLRSGLNGELIRSIGILIFIFGSLIDKTVLEVFGFIVFNIGWLILATYENQARKEIYRQTTVAERLLGKLPRKQNQSKSQTTYDKVIGIVTGIICLLTALTYYKRTNTIDITDVLFIGMLGFAGVFFIIFSIFKKTQG
jgi:hypothetical protein